MGQVATFPSHSSYSIFSTHSTHSSHHPRPFNLFYPSHPSNLQHPTHQLNLSNLPQNWAASADSPVRPMSRACVFAIIVDGRNPQKQAANARRRSFSKARPHCEGARRSSSRSLSTTPRYPLRCAVMIIFGAPCASTAIYGREKGREWRFPWRFSELFAPTLSRRST